MRDLPPESNEGLRPQDAAADLSELSAFAQLADHGTEPEPTDEELARDIALYDAEGDVGAALRRTASPLDAVQWPANDAISPDYAHLAGIAAPASFTLTPEVLDRVISANGFQPSGTNDAVAFALRGARLKSGLDTEVAGAIELEDVRPNHLEFRCVIGFYFTAKRTLSLYTGSTVPCRKAVHGFMMGGEASNLLPTGLYSYYVWRHKTLQPALRLSSSNASVDALE
jgi:hypothetical protein